MDKKSQRLKYLVLAALFIVPLIFFLFLASGRVNFKRLAHTDAPVVELPKNDQSLAFQNNITVLSFLGNDFDYDDYNKLLNLYEFIYKSMIKYRIFQIVTLVDVNHQSLIEKVKKKMRDAGEGQFLKWHFLPLSKEAIAGVFKGLAAKNISLEEVQNFSKVFIIDDLRRLKGRIEDDKIKTAYQVKSLSKLKDELRDDLKVLFYELKFSKER